MDAKDTGQREGYNIGLDIGFIRGFGLVNLFQDLINRSEEIGNENNLKIKQVSSQLVQ